MPTSNSASQLQQQMYNRPNYSMLQTHNQKMTHYMPGKAKNSNASHRQTVLQTTSRKPQAEQGIYGYLKDTYYNFKFKSRAGVTSSK